MKRGLLAGLGLALLGLFIHAVWVDTAHVEVTHHVMSGKPSAAPAIKVVQLSDLHIQRMGPFEHQVLSEVQRIAPDLVVFTGDMLDRPEALEALLSFWSGLGSLPKIAVLGNWEHWSGVDLLALKQGLEARGGKLLVNESHAMPLSGRMLQVVGLDDYTASAPNAGLLESIGPGPSLVLQHSPGWFQTADVVQRRWQATGCLSGHTHGGQLALLGFPVWRPRGSGSYLAGRYELPFCSLYVSRGLGTSILPVRWGARAEIAVFEL